jgi:hypothetical protein
MSEQPFAVCSTAEPEIASGFSIVSLRRIWVSDRHRELALAFVTHPARRAWVPETQGSIVPSKIYGIMAAGRPLLYIGPDGSTPARHIQDFGCGWRIRPGDVDGLVQLLHHLNLNRDLLVEAGARGRAAFERNFDHPLGVARVHCCLSSHDTPIPCFSHFGSCDASHPPPRDRTRPTLATNCRV